MPTELTDGDILQYTLHASYQGQQILNTMNFKVTQFEPDPIDYEDAGLAFLQELSAPGDFIEDLEALLVDGFVMEDHRVQRVFPTRNRAVVEGLSLAGNVITTGSTVNQAAVVTKYGAEAARWAIGSWHQAGLPINVFLPTGMVDVTAIDNLVTALAGLATTHTIEGFAGTSFTPVLWSPKVPARVTPIVGILGQYEARVMRRRTVGVGK